MGISFESELECTGIKIQLLELFHEFGKPPAQLAFDQANLECYLKALREEPHFMCRSLFLIELAGLARYHDAIALSDEFQTTAFKLAELVLQNEPADFPAVGRLPIAYSAISAFSRILECLPHMVNDWRVEQLAQMHPIDYVAPAFGENKEVLDGVLTFSMKFYEVKPNPTPKQISTINRAISHHVGFKRTIESTDALRESGLELDETHMLLRLIHAHRGLKSLYETLSETHKVERMPMPAREHEKPQKKPDGPQGKKGANPA